MKISSKTIKVNKTAGQLNDFLSQVANFEQLMPKNISKFEVIGSDSFVFALKGMPEIGLELKEVDRPGKVRLGAISDKLPFNLTAMIREEAENECEAYLEFEGDFNPMMSMMIKGPITKFLDTLTDNMQKL